MALAAHLTLGARWTFVGGKGGVGKTTVAAALAVELADGGERVTLLSTDPAHSLGDALGLPLAADPRPHPDLPFLESFELSASKEMADFLAASGDAVGTLIERGTYLDADDAHVLTDLALPGMDELAALLRLSRLSDQGDRRVIVDTAPTGHTLRLLDLPAVGLAWLESLEAMQAKHDAVAAAFSGGLARPDEAARFIAGLQRDLERLSDSFSNANETRFALVTNPEAAVTAETLRYREQLETRGIHLAGIILNRANLPVGAGENASRGSECTGEDPPSLDIAVRIPWLPGIGNDLPSLRVVARNSVPGRAADAGPESNFDSRGAGPGISARDDGFAVGDRYIVPGDRRLYLIGGKGGVGKSTIAAAVGVSLAGRTRGRILVLSVDPAGSLSEILAQRVGSTPKATGERGNLFAQQVDAGGAWKEFTTRYRREVDSVFAGLGGGSVSATLDRDVVDRLIDLAPPGVDELMAVMEVIDLLEDGEYDALILDTAPTGHFLRLLELPDIALDWCHAMLRLLLKYRSVIRLEGAGERILDLSRALKALRGRLVDPAFTWVGVVALPETLSIPETGRLIEGLRRLGIEPGAVIVNRALVADRAIADERYRAVARILSIAPTVPAAATPQLDPAPSGEASLDAFHLAWRSITIGAVSP